MVNGLTQLIGGYAMRQRDLRLLYVAMFLSFLGASIAFPLRLLYAQAHHATPEQIGLMAAAFFLAPLVAQLPMGWLVDSWGRVPVLMLGLIGHTVISLLFVLLSTPVDFIILRFLEGVTVAALQPAMNAYVADVTPEEHRSEAYGTLTATFNAGLLIGPLLGGLIGQYASIVTAYYVCIAIEAAAVALMWGRIREPARREARHETFGDISRRRLITLPLVGAYAAFFSAQIVMGILSALWTIWLRDLGGSYTYIGLTIALFALPQIFLGTQAGRLSVRWGRTPLLLITGLLVGAVYLIYGVTSSLTLIVVLGIVEGIFVAFQQPVTQGLLADASPPEARGRAQGIAGTVGAIGGGMAAFVALPLYHEAHALPFMLAGVAMAAGSVVAAVGAAALVQRRAAATVPVVAATA